MPDGSEVTAATRWQQGIGNTMDDLSFLRVVYDALSSHRIIPFR